MTLELLVKVIGSTCAEKGHGKCVRFLQIVEYLHIEILNLLDH